MIYLATPYSHPDPGVMESRFDTACHIAGALMKAGFTVFSPIAHTHPIAVRCVLPRGWEFWKKYDEESLAACDCLVVAMMDGWRESKGVAGEVEIAKGLSKPIYYCEVRDLLDGTVSGLGGG